ncbi:MAG: hypothetical protein KF900_02815 [Bacteroidetes bacterium]|nr:hypothetical protein [Bacteroidota bacterium]
MKSSLHTFFLIFGFIFLSGFLQAQKTAQTPSNNPNGYNKFYYENGKLSSEGMMKNGKPDGYWKNYYKNGHLKIEGNRKNFQLDSIWKFYDEKGRLSKTINYTEGKKNGETVIYDTAQKVMSVETYSNDVREGISKTFYKDGARKTETIYNNGKKEGYAYEFAQDSLITGLSNYKGGVLQSYEKFNQRDEQNKKQGIWKEFQKDNITIKKEMKYNSDSLDGYVKEYDAKGNLLVTKKFNNGKQILKAPEIANVEVFRDIYEDGTLKYEGVYLDGTPIGSHYKYIQKMRCDSSLFLKDDSTAKRIEDFVYIKRLVCRNVPMPDSCIEYFDGTVVARGAVDSVRNRIGIWEEFHNTGEFKGKGIYREGNRTGEWQFFYSSGQLEQKGKYDKKGKAQGVWEWYYESGQLMRQENYLNGKRDGEITDYAEDGKVEMKGYYVDGKREGLWTYETPGYLEIGKFTNDERDSLWKSYYMPQKTKYYEGAFEAGEAIGVHTAYHSNGKKKMTGNYVGGMKDGDWKYFDEEEFLYLTITYKTDIEIKWQGQKITPTYEESLRTYNINIKLDNNRTQTIKK